MADAVNTEQGVILEALNNKVDLNQLNTNNQELSYVSGLGMPSDKYIDLTLGASGMEFTAPSNGYVYFQGRNNVADGQIFIGNITCGYNASVRSYGKYTNSLVLPVKKGDVFGVYYDGSLSVSNLKFFYSVGSESEE